MSTFASAGRRERSKVPYIVRQCIEEVEKRGIDEVGIYRISGVATDIQALKTAFDTSKALSYHMTFLAALTSLLGWRAAVRLFTFSNWSVCSLPPRVSV